MHTPFFPQLLARFAPCRRRLQQVRPTRLFQLEHLLVRFLPPGLLAPADEGPNSRQRVFSRRRTFWGFLYQVLHPGCPCRKVVRHTRAFFKLHRLGHVDRGTSAYCQARLRLPLDTLSRLRHAVAARVEQLLPQARQTWFGLHPKVIDGTTVTAPDTLKNQRLYPQSRSQKRGCAVSPSSSWSASSAWPVARSWITSKATSTSMNWPWRVSSWTDSNPTIWPSVTEASAAMS